MHQITEGIRYQRRAVHCFVVVLLLLLGKGIVLPGLLRGQFQTFPMSISHSTRISERILAIVPVRIEVSQLSMFLIGPGSRSLWRRRLCFCRRWRGGAGEVIAVRTLEIERGRVVGVNSWLREGGDWWDWG